MKKLLILLLVLAFNPAAADQHELTAETFTEEFVRALAAEQPEGGFEVVAPLEIVIGDGETEGGRINLHNLYRNASDDPAERAGQISTYISAILSEPTETLSSADLPNILPVIRDSAFVAQATLNRDDPTVNEPLVADLSVLYVLDFPDRVQFLMESNLAELDLDLEEIRALAVSNLSAKSDDYIVHTMEQIYFLELDGMYESSALLLDEFWTDVESNIGAEPVVAIPTRDIVIFAPANDPLGIELVRMVAEQIEEDTGYPVSKTLLIRRDGGWAKYQ
ncbi:MAG: DUF1444 family protein [Woeseiaceae bacterium]|nr:DUF1444 family protein [Woeseiaceae bacterium]